MKLSPWKKGIVSWRDGRWLYLSIPFTWLLPAAKKIAEAHDGFVCAGGPAVALCGARWATETRKSIDVDVLALHNPDATFTTRGCPNCCDFCAVPKTEGEFKELRTWKVAPIICDNNLTAASKAHFLRVIESLRSLSYVDFNQGLDVRLFTRWHADRIAWLRRAKVRFSLDHSSVIPKLVDAIGHCRRAGLREFGVYVLMGFRDTPADAMERLEFVRSLGIRPNPMRYQPLHAEKKNDYLALGWTEEEMRKMVHYYSRLRWTAGIPYKDFDRSLESHGVRKK